MGILQNPARTMKRALKFVARDFNRPALTVVHLDGRGDVVTTDSYRLYCERGAYEGETIDVPFAMAKDISKMSVKCQTARFFVEGELLKCEIGGKTLSESVEHVKFPNYAVFVESPEPTTKCFVDPKQMGPILRAHMGRKKDGKVRVFADGGNFRLAGFDLADGDPSVTFANACEGADTRAAFNASLLESSLSVFENFAELWLTEPHKPMTVVNGGGNIRAVIMPVALPKSEVDGLKKQQKEEKMAKKTTKPTKATDDELRRAIEHAAKDRAANDPDGRVQGGNASSYERNLLFEYERAGQLTSAVHGDFTSWYREGKFLVCVERRYSKRKIHLTYPELTPKFHKVDLVAGDAQQEPKSGGFADAFAKKCKEKTGIDLEVTPIDGGGYAAKPKGKATEKKEDSVDKRIAELEKKLKAAEAKAKMWEAKAEEYYAANAKAAELEPEPAPAESVATVVSLATMQEWCKAHEGTSTAQYGAATDTIWVYGVKRNEKQLKDELKAMGFAWAGKARHGAGWWAKPTV